MPPKRTVLPVFLDHAGCKGRCAFCNQRSAVGKIKDPMDQIAEMLSSFSPGQDRPEAQVAFYGGDYLALSSDRRREMIAEVKRLDAHGAVSGFRCSTRPDSVTKQSAEELFADGFTTVEIGAQCLDDDVLRAIDRHHCVEDVQRASEMIRARNMELGLHLMFGLPGQSRAVNEKSLHLAAKCRPDFLRLFPTLVLEGTRLERDFWEGAFRPLELEEAERQIADAVAFFAARKIAVAQIGLHPAEQLVSGESLIAGPFDPRFGERVIQRLWLDAAGRAIVAAGLDSEMTLTAHPSDLSKLIGPGRIGVALLVDRFGLSSLNMKADCNIARDHLCAAGRDSRQVVSVF